MRFRKTIMDLCICIKMVNNNGLIRKKNKEFIEPINYRYNITDESESDL